MRGTGRHHLRRLEISAQPTGGIGYEIDAIAAVVLGGTGLFGGRGRLYGALIGSVILGLLSTGLILMNIQFFTQLLIPQPEAPLPANL